MWLEMMTCSPSAAELLEQSKRFRARHRIQPIQRLIQHKHGGLMRDRLREPDALPHAFAIAGDFAIGGFQKIHPRNRLVRQRLHMRQSDSRAASARTRQTAVR